MVFAVWAARRDVYGHVREEIEAAVAELRAARSWAAEHLERIVELAQARRPRPPGFYETYFRTLNYDLDLSARAGFGRYVAELATIGLLPGVRLPPDVDRVAS